MIFGYILVPKSVFRYYNNLILRLLLSNQICFCTGKMSILDVRNFNADQHGELNDNVRERLSKLVIRRVNKIRIDDDCIDVLVGYFGADSPQGVHRNHQLERGHTEDELASVTQGRVDVIVGAAIEPPQPSVLHIGQRPNVADILHVRVGASVHPGT